MFALGQSGSCSALGNSSKAATWTKKQNDCVDDILKRFLCQFPFTQSVSHCGTGRGGTRLLNAFVTRDYGTLLRCIECFRWVPAPTIEPHPS